jgi:hypothetical protein
VSFGTYLAVYSAALLLGVIGHTPGGLGVFEATLLFVLGTAVHPNQAVAALLAYRAVYSSRRSWFRRRCSRPSRPAASCRDSRQPAAAPRRTWSGSHRCCSGRCSSPSSPSASA